VQCIHISVISRTCNYHIFVGVCIKIVLVTFKCVVFMEFSLHFKLEMYFNFIVFCVKKNWSKNNNSGCLFLI